MRYYRPTWAEVDLNNLAYNFNQVKKRVAPETKIMVTVKADAYGHGLIPVAKKLCSLGADYLGVASIDEGIKLREQNIRLPILVLGLIFKSDVSVLLKYNLTPTICTEELAAALNNKAASNGKKIKVHIKIDTGMGRIGILCSEAPNFIKKISKSKFISIEGVFTHLACADISSDFTLRQLEAFEGLISGLERDGIHVPLVHAANSLGVINYRQSHFNMVRPGLVIYGLYPAEGLDIKLKPVLSLKTKVVYVKRVPKGYGISYGHSYMTKKETTVLTLPIGYGDGYPRNLSNRADVLIRGRRFKISGRICMDQIMIDAGDLEVKAGEEVVLIGAQGKDRITTEELACFCETIPYEIVCGLGSRVPRIYTV